ncbi:hypothetical protein [Nonomuraea basaltis]|uniref:hypothetical protein n=1 Tax=Nonomuraea basaltis TaxID=2495887 RepID=UPI00110C6AE6|nr:hypothetical protein [Nonomuraea basaltis]TMR92863.1 hypothetical protein EJK15_42215 [Nonomuraea basaltis]
MSPLGLAATITTSGSAKDIDLGHWEYMPIAEVAPQLGNFSPAFLIAVRDGFLMVGSGGKGRRPESWYSRDGLAWERGNLGDAISDGYATDVVPRGRGALAMLIVLDRNGVPHSAIWETADGRTWKMGRQLPADVAALPVPHLTAYQGDAIVVTSAGRLWIGEPGKPWRRTGPALRRDCHLDDAAPVDTPLGVLLLAGCPGGPEHGLSPGSVLLMDGKGVTHEITKELPLMHVEATAGTTTRQENRVEGRRRPGRWRGRRARRAVLDRCGGLVLGGAKARLIDRAQVDGWSRCRLR